MEQAGELAQKLMTDYKKNQTEKQFSENKAEGEKYVANYAKGKMLWNNRLQLDYGFLYSADKPILQKSKDRIYLESKWGYETAVKNLLVKLKTHMKI